MKTTTKLLLPAFLFCMGVTTACAAEASTVLILPSADSIPAVKKEVVEIDSKVFQQVEVEASFPGGLEGWRTFLERNLKANTPVKRKAPAGQYMVVVQFIVDKTGAISNIQPLTAHGYGMEEEVVRVIKKSPKWVPAVQNGRPVKAYRRQPITFVVS